MPNDCSETSNQEKCDAINKNFIDSEQWNYKRIAWEFLIRNENFKKRCDEVDATNSSDLKKSVAEDFHLLRYKSYKSKFNEKEPSFDSSHVKYTIGYCGAPSKIIKIKKEPLTMIVKIDFAPIIQDTSTLDRKLNHIKKLVLGAIKDTEPSVKINYNQGKRNKDVCIKQLKLLDFLEANFSKNNALFVVYKSSEKDTKTSIRDSHKNEIGRAKELRDKDYYLLAMHD